MPTLAHPNNLNRPSADNTVADYQRLSVVEPNAPDRLDTLDRMDASDRLGAPHKTQAEGPVEVLATDDHIIVVNKPAGLLSVPGRSSENYDSVLTRMQQRFGEAHAAHRLDMATSGVMVLARNKQALRHINAQFANQSTEKRYVAKVFGLVEHDSGTINVPLKCDWPNRPRQMVATDGKPSETHYSVLAREQANNCSLVDLTPITGRSHQLRVHLQSIGHPILGDEFYAHPSAQAMADRLLLHARLLAFQHPATGERLAFSTYLPF